MPCCKNPPHTHLLLRKCAAEIGCYHPLRDVVTPPRDARGKQWLAKTQGMTVDQIVAGKKRYTACAVPTI